MDGVNLSGYKIVKPFEFAYVADTSRRGDKISLAFNLSDKSYLVSSISTVFKANEDKLDSEFLFMYFNRPEFDRLARYHSWGSAREVFGQDDFCNIEITVPPIEIQKKYVAVYQAMLANQQAYEQGIDELKLVCDIAIEKIKKNSNYIKVGDIVEEINNRNIGGNITNLQGINISKTFMPSVAKINNENIEKYKVVKSNEFAYSAMQTGRDECIRIALYSDDEPCIVSPAYSVLAVKNTDVLPEYFMQWFSRKESDRYGAFVSDSSVRASLELSEFFEIKIPIPELSVQKSIVDIYKVYLERKAISEKLKEQIKNICPILIKGAVADSQVS